MQTNPDEVTSDTETSSSEPSASSEATEIDLEKSGGITERKIVRRMQPQETLGVRFYLRKHSGITRALSHSTYSTVLLEGPYYNHNPVFKPSITSCDRIILLAGGIGITAVLSFVHAHQRTELFWSAKTSSQALIDDVQSSGLLERLGDDIVLNIGGSRFDFFNSLTNEAHVTKTTLVKEGRIGVVVCGPSSFCDDARAAVVAVGRKAIVDFNMCEEAFNW